MVQNACAIIKKKLYFLASDKIIHPQQNIVIINIDLELLYQGYYGDFGPLNLSCIYKYCQNMNKKLKINTSTPKRIIHVTSSDPRRKVNSAFLMGCFMMVHLKMTPQETYKLLTQNNYRYISFRDAAVGRSTFYLSLVNCFRGFHKAISCKILKLRLLNINEYDHYNSIKNGDINWIIPKKLLAFTGPQYKSQYLQGYLYHTPEMYISIFHKWRVSVVVRLNPPEYDEKSFSNAGFEHCDLIFPDGGVPSEKLVRKFLEIVDNSTGAVAVHCKAGLGRTGTLIACYLMKQYRFTAGESIAWIRICRPGSIIGYQQNWLMDHQSWCWRIRPCPNDLLRRTSTNRSGDNKIQLISPKDSESPVPNITCNDTLAKYQNGIHIPQGDMLNSVKSFNQINHSLSNPMNSNYIPNVLLDCENYPKFGRNRLYNHRNKQKQLDVSQNQIYPNKISNAAESQPNMTKNSMFYQSPMVESNNGMIIPDFDIRQQTSKLMISKMREH